MATKHKTETKEVRRFWGGKDKCIEFLQSPQALSDRWLIEAIGE